MPKVKTHKGARKRFRVTANGKLARSSAGKKHLNSPKSGKRKRHLRAGHVDTGKLPSKYVKIMGEVIAGMKVRRERMLSAVQDGFMNATDLADYLVERALPFRAAHAVAGKVVQFCLAHGKRIEELTLVELKRFSDKFEKNVYKYLSAEAAVERRRAVGGTARGNVVRRLRELRD